MHIYLLRLLLRNCASSSSSTGGSLTGASLAAHADAKTRAVLHDNRAISSDDNGGHSGAVLMAVARPLGCRQCRGLFRISGRRGVTEIDLSGGEGRVSGRVSGGACRILEVAGMTPRAMPHRGSVAWVCGLGESPADGLDLLSFSWPRAGGMRREARDDTPSWRGDLSLL